MITRRALLQRTAALAAIPMFPLTGSVGRHPGDDTETAAPCRFVFDERFHASVEAARRARQEGVAISGIHGDVTWLWYHDLYFRWKEGPGVLAGMTGADSLFCLDVLARDAGMRVTARTERPDGLISWVIGPRR